MTSLFNTNINQEVEEGELPEDGELTPDPTPTPKTNPPQPTKQRTQHSSDSEDFIFETVQDPQDHEYAAEKKKKRIAKQEHPSKTRSSHPREMREKHPPADNERKEPKKASPPKQEEPSYQQVNPSTKGNPRPNAPYFNGYQYHGMHNPPNTANYPAHQPYSAPHYSQPPPNSYQGYNPNLRMMPSSAATHGSHYRQPEPPPASMPPHYYPNNNYNAPQHTQTQQIKSNSNYHQNTPNKQEPSKRQQTPQPQFKTQQYQQYHGPAQAQPNTPPTPNNPNNHSSNHSHSNTPYPPVREFKADQEPTEKKPQGIEGVKQSAKKGLKGIPSQEQHQILEMLKCIVKHGQRKRALFPQSNPGSSSKDTISDNVFESNLSALQKLLETPEEDKRQSVLQLMKTLQMQETLRRIKERRIARKLLNDAQLIPLKKTEESGASRDPRVMLRAKMK